MTISAIWQLLTATFTQWTEHKPLQLAAALSYYTIFSLAPLLLIAIAVAGLVFGREASQQQILSTLQGLVGPQGAQAIQAMLQNASTPSSGILATVIGVGTLLIGAGGVVGQLQDSLNTLWGVMPKPGLGLMGVVRARLFSFALVLGIGFLLLVSLIVSAALTAFLHFVAGASAEKSFLWHGVELLVSFGLITLLFALIYKVLPDVRLAWRDVGIGAALTALLFTLGKLGIGLYLGHSGVSSAYGAAGSLIVVLLWVYYSALIFFFGAALTQVYANTYGTGMTPAEHAMAVRTEQQAPAKQASHTSEPTSAHRLTGPEHEVGTGSSLVQSIEVEVPVRTAYNQWTQFEDFPHFMGGVEAVTQLDTTHLHWKASIGGVTKEWEAVITEQTPDQRIAWTNTTGARNAGVVTFHRLTDQKTRVMLHLEYEPEGFAENVGDMIGVVSTRIRADLRRFKHFIEARGHATGAWRGEVPPQSE